MIYCRYLSAGGSQSEQHTQAHKQCMGLLAYGLQRERGIRLTEQTLIPTPCGKPALRDHPEIHFNLSHCDGMACCIIADRPVGIDVERVRPYNPHAARHACGDGELTAIEGARDPSRAFFCHWTLKESCLKAMGIGLAYPLKELAFRLDGKELYCPSKPEYRFRLWQEAGYVLAACVLVDPQNGASNLNHIFSIWGDAHG